MVEVTQPRDHYRTYSLMGGLFCERSFGPVKSWECHCGKYKRCSIKDQFATVLGSKVTEKKVRKKRMGDNKSRIGGASCSQFGISILK